MAPTQAQRTEPRNWPAGMWQTQVRGTVASPDTIRSYSDRSFCMEWCPAAPRRADDEFDTEVPQRCWRPLVAVLSASLITAAVLVGQFVVRKGY